MSMKLRLLSGLQELQEKTIGIAKIHGNIEMVINESEIDFTTIWIGNLGGISECHYPKSQFQFERFPIEFKTLENFLKHPNRFHNWYNECLA